MNNSYNRYIVTTLWGKTTRSFCRMLDCSRNFRNYEKRVILIIHHCVGNLMSQFRSGPLFVVAFSILASIASPQASQADGIRVDKVNIQGSGKSIVFKVTLSNLDDRVLTFDGESLKSNEIQVSDPSVVFQVAGTKLTFPKALEKKSFSVTVPVGDKSIIVAPYYRVGQNEPTVESVSMYLRVRNLTEHSWDDIIFNYSNGVLHSNSNLTLAKGLETSVFVTKEPLQESLPGKRLAYWIKSSEFANDSGSAELKFQMKGNWPKKLATTGAIQFYRNEEILETSQTAATKPDEEFQIKIGAEFFEFNGQKPLEINVRKSYETDSVRQAILGPMWFAYSVSKTAVRDAGNPPAFIQIDSSNGEVVELGKTTQYQVEHNQEHLGLVIANDPTTMPDSVEKTPKARLKVLETLKGEMTSATLDEVAQQFKYVAEKVNLAIEREALLKQRHVQEQLTGTDDQKNQTRDQINNLKAALTAVIGQYNAWIANERDVDSNAKLQTALSKLEDLIR